MQRGEGMQMRPREQVNPIQQNAKEGGIRKTSVLHGAKAMHLSKEGSAYRKDILP